MGLGACKPAGAEILEAGSGFSETVPASADEDEDDFIAEQAFATAPELAAATKLPPKAGLAASERPAVSEPLQTNALPTTTAAEAIAPAPIEPAIASVMEPGSAAEVATSAAVLLAEATPLEIVQAPESAPEAAETSPTSVLTPLQTYQPLVQYQAVTIVQDGDFAGRLRASALYAISPQVLFGATVDLTTGDAFVDSRESGLSLNELYVAAAPIRDLPNLRVVAGLLDLTSYFDRNSFAKDGATHFFNPVFQTNPALSAAGIATRPGLLLNWSATDQLELKAAAFSSRRNLGEFAIDGFAAEVGYRIENLIVRGTYASGRDAGSNDGFSEIFQFNRGSRFGLREGDRESSFGLNAEYFIESLNLGLFGRYGRYENAGVDRGGDTFNLGINALDVFRQRDRLGLAYGQQLSNSDLRRGKRPDVWELFYDMPVASRIRAGVSLQSRDELSETVLGIRLRADW